MSDDEFAGGDATAAGHGGDRDKRAPRFSWTPAYEATFFRSLCESVQLGLRDNHSFKAEAWDRAAAALRDKHGAYPTKSHLVNKSDNARKKFRLWRGLREDPEFLYNPTNKTVTASEEAWKAHIEKEPLSRALRGRPFEHEEFMEILYPDVVGSRGAPKRIMKPKRKGPDALPGADEGDMPGTAVLDLQVEPAYVPQPQPALAPARSRQSMSVTPGAAAQNLPPVPLSHPRPTSTAIPPRTSIASTSALTPPEETTHTRKRFMAPHAGATSAAAATPVVAASLATDHSKTTAPTTAGRGLPPDKRRRISTNTSTSMHTSHAGTSNDASATASVGRQLLEDGLLGIAELLKARTTPKWPEKAMDIFFREFADEDMDLQLKIAEKVLADDTKAMVFCKMTNPLRKHWMNRLREVHNNRNT